MIAAAAFMATATQAQTVDEIIGKHIDALGGKDKLSQVKSIYTESSIDVMGNSAPQKEYLLEGKGYKNEIDFNGTNIINCYNDKGGWMINPMAGGSDPQALPNEAYQAGRSQIFVGGVLVDYAAKGYKAELDGKDGDLFKIKVTGTGNETYYYLDPKTYLVTKTVIKGEVMGQQVDVTTTYSDYKKTDFGITVPYAKNIDMGMFQLAQKIEKIEVNKSIDENIFAMPK